MAVCQEPFLIHYCEAAINHVLVVGIERGNLWKVAPYLNPWFDRINQVFKPLEEGNEQVYKPQAHDGSHQDSSRLILDKLDPSRYGHIA